MGGTMGEDDADIEDGHNDTVEEQGPATTEARTGNAMTDLLTIEARCASEPLESCNGLCAWNADDNSCAVSESTTNDKLMGGFGTEKLMQVMNMSLACHKMSKNDCAGECEVLKGDSSCDLRQAVGLEIAGGEALAQQGAACGRRPESACDGDCDWSAQALACQLSPSKVMAAMGVEQDNPMAKVMNASTGCKKIESREACKGDCDFDKDKGRCDVSGLKVMEIMYSGPNSLVANVSRLPAQVPAVGPTEAAAALPVTDSPPQRSLHAGRADDSGRAARSDTMSQMPAGLGQGLMPPRNLSGNASKRAKVHNGDKSRGSRSDRAGAAMDLKSVVAAIAGIAAPSDSPYAGQMARQCGCLNHNLTAVHRDSLKCPRKDEADVWNCVNCGQRPCRSETGPVLLSFTGLQEDHNYMAHCAAGRGSSVESGALITSDSAPNGVFSVSFRLPVHGSGPSSMDSHHKTFTKKGHKIVVVALWISLAFFSLGISGALVLLQRKSWFRKYRGIRSAREPDDHELLVSGVAQGTDSLTAVSDHDWAKLEGGPE